MNKRCGIKTRFVLYNNSQSGDASVKLEADNRTRKGIENDETIQLNSRFTNQLDE
ncbi:MAG: TerD family protein [Desmonostoc geniculatum HA4340-LM1]|nr:TerD family protein [Desmonostoc geniculatum HA4340-LM1]